VDSGDAKRETVVITGASAGLGRATAREFGRRVANVGLLARGTDGLEAAKREIEELGGTATYIPTDVADAAAVEQAANTIEEQFGPIDTWVNNAMTSVFSPVKQMKPDEYKRVTEVTATPFCVDSVRPDRAQGAHDHEAKEHDLPLVRQGRA
jgi:NADP-dependent 3-hydroxy acid dehydrogenase YdfG